MSSSAFLLDRQAAVDSEETDLLYVFDNIESLTGRSIDFGSLEEAVFGVIGQPESLRIFVACLESCKGLENVPPQSGRRKALYNEYRDSAREQGVDRMAAARTRYPHLMLSELYVPANFESPVVVDINHADERLSYLLKVGSSVRLREELSELNAFLACDKHFGEIGEDAIDDYFDGDWSEAKTDWAVLFWLAQESVAKGLMIAWL